MRNKNQRGEAVAGSILVLYGIGIFVIGIVHCFDKTNDEIISRYGEFPPKASIRSNQLEIDQRKEWLAEHDFDPNKWVEDFYSLHHKKKRETK